jgi:hypothetical protein
VNAWAPNSSIESGEQAPSLKVWVSPHIWRKADHEAPGAKFRPLEVREFQEILFLKTLSPAIFGKRANFSVKRTPLLREEVGRTVSGPAKIEEEIHSLCGALVASEGGLAR